MTSEEISQILKKAYAHGKHTGQHDLFIYLIGIRYAKYLHTMNLAVIVLDAGLARSKWEVLDKGRQMALYVELKKKPSFY